MVHPEPTELSRLACDLWRHTAPSLRDASTVLVALSGGLDSTVLLSLLVELRQAGHLLPPLEAIHVHHGLQAEADSWAVFNHRLCEASAVYLHVVQVQVDLASGQGLEAAAREARYRAFAEQLPPGGVLLQAHHADDQCETLLLHLLRGSGPRGLAGIPAERALGAGRLLRPLLSCTRGELLHHAQERSLEWVEDPSNMQTRLDRNFLRHRVLPVLRERWPHLAQGLGRSGVLLEESSVLLDELAAIDLAQARGETPHRLRIAALQELSVARRHNLLRYWIRSIKGEAVGIPGPVLRAGLPDLLAAREDRSPLLAWDSGACRLELRRYRGELYLLEACSDTPWPELAWTPTQPLPLPGGLGSLVLDNAGTALPPDCRLEVRWRQGGERMQLAGRGTHTLKNLLQEQGVPVWLRDRLPLVFGGGELLVVPGLYVSSSWPGFIGSRQATIVWQDPLAELPAR